MIKHVVFLKFKADATEAMIAKIEAGLGALPGIIPEIRYYDFGRDVVHSPRSWDFALVSLFDDLDALKTVFRPPGPPGRPPEDSRGDGKYRGGRFRDGQDLGSGAGNR